MGERCSRDIDFTLPVRRSSLALEDEIEVEVHVSPESRRREPAARMTFRIINPESLGAPRGFSHGLLGPATGRLLFVAGQTAADASGKLAARGFVEQWERALEKVLVVVKEAGGSAEDIGRLTIYVTDLDGYRSNLAPLGEAYRKLMGSHYPAMALVEVAGLVDGGAVVEIEATAVVP
jgi:enamine deaminase RidA (YjgF/YER057c/UK114 family)